MIQNCPKCGTTLDIESSTLTGRKMREYWCPACHWSRTDDLGVALWKVMSEANEEQEREQAKKKKEKGLIKRLLGKWR